MEVGLGPGDFVLDGDLAPPKAQPPQFSAHVHCGETAGWTTMPLGTEVGLGPGNIVLDGVPAPPPKRGRAPNFRPMSIVATRSPISATAELLFRGVPFCPAHYHICLFQQINGHDDNVGLTWLL